MLAVAVGGPRLWNVLRRSPSGQNMSIDGAQSGPPTPFTRTPLTGAAPTGPTAPTGPPYLTSVSPDRRHFLDQYGQPILIRGDAPWSLMTRLSPEQAQLWFSHRARQGVNAAIVSLIGAEDNGAPDDSGRTYDGLSPFTDGDILTWNEPYWQRAHDYVQLAADHGITVLLYPIDGWTIGHSFVPASIGQCRAYGAKVATRFRDLPNIVWMSGGDYAPQRADPTRGNDVDECIEAMLRGVRETGDRRPFSMQLSYPTSVSTDDPYWASRVDWNFVYTYFPTYRAVLDAYRRQPTIPALMGESNYEGENNQAETKDTTGETLRRQVLWALTSGSAGDIYGTRDWKFDPGWEHRLDSPGAIEMARLRTIFAELPWWQMVPDVNETFVTGGRGTRLDSDEPMDVLDNDYVTAAITADGRAAAIYVPTARTITIDRTRLADGVRATWIDPSSGARHPAPVSATLATPGRNAGGDQDWLLVVATSPPR